MHLCSSGLLALAALFSAACAQTHDARADLTAQSGTRLRLRWLEGEGVSVVLGFHDAQLGVSCAVRRAADGELYCFPGAMQPKFFVDASCSESATPVARCASTSAAQTTVVTWAGGLAGVGACPRSTASLYTVEAPRVFHPFFESRGGMCSPESAFGPEPPFPGQRVVAPVPESALVHVTEVMSPGDGPLQSRHYVGDDGSVLPIGYFDARFGACAPGLAADGQMRCLPRAAGSLSAIVFVDPTCSMEGTIAERAPGCDAAPRRVAARSELDTRQGACGAYIRRFFEIGEPVTVAYGGPPTCGESGTGPDQAVHRVSPELDPTTFASLDVVEMGTGRVRIKGWAAPGLEPVFGASSDQVVWEDTQVTPFPFTDGQLSLSCSATVTADGVLRCAPMASASAYSDEGCTRPIVYNWSPCEPGSGPALARLDNGACMVAVHKVAREPEALAMSFFASGSLCRMSGNGAARGYALEEAVDVSMFAPMRERVE